MRFTRLADRIRIAALIATAAAASAGAAVSCSDDDAGAPVTNQPDGAATEAAVSDAAAPDARIITHDAQTSDAGPRAVVCDGGSCATALVAGSGNSFCVLMSDATVACWGENDAYALGRGADAGNGDSANAARVVGLTNIASLGRSCAVDRDGAAYGWGPGPWLQDPMQVQTNEPTPVKLPIPPATLIDARVDRDGTAVACAVVDGGALCWGQNLYAQVAPLEAGVDPTLPLAPTLVPLPPGAPATALVVGNATFVVRQDGTAVSWGASPPLARVSSLFPDPYPDEIPLQGITTLAVVEMNACATAQGIAYCWGNDDGPMANRLPSPLVTDKPVVRIATTFGHNNLYDPQRACMVDIDGDVYCYGANTSGQVGDGTKNYALVPKKVQGLPGPAADIALGIRTSCALLADGHVYCWGDDTNGQLGSGKIKVPLLAPGEVILP